MCNESLYRDDIEGIKKMREEGKTLDEVIDWIEERWGSSIPKETIEEAIEVYNGTWIDWAKFWNDATLKRLTDKEKKILIGLVIGELARVSRGLPKPNSMKVIGVPKEILESINERLDYKVELERLLTKLGSD